MIAFLLGLIPNFLKVYLGLKVDTAENLGKSEQKTVDLQAALDVANAEAKAAANAPTEMEQLITKQRKGDV